MPQECPLTPWCLSDARVIHSAHHRRANPRVWALLSIRLNAAYYTYAYDTVGQLTSIRDSDADQTLFTFTWEAMGQLGLRADPGAGGIDYAHDRLDRMSSIAHTFSGGTGNVADSFGYNPASQIESRTRDNDAYAWTAKATSRSYDVNGLNQYESTAFPGGGTVGTYTYDANGNMTSSTSSSGTTNYVYDVENRLVAVSGARTIALEYDPLGRFTGSPGPRATGDSTGTATRSPPNTRRWGGTLAASTCTARRRATIRS